MHHGMLFQQLSSRPHAKDKHRWAESLVLQKIYGGMWSKGAWTWLKAKASSGRTNNASKGVDERVWAVQLVEHAGTKVTKWRWSRWRKTKIGRARGTLGRSAQAGRPPLFKHPLPRCSSLAGKQLSQLSICVLKVLVQNHLRLSHPSQDCFAQQITPLIHSKSILQNNFCVLCYRLKPRD
jgi:hypothetical protein